MKQFRLKTEIPAGLTGVPNVFLDHYMPGANGEYVKVYLYLLRALGDPSRELSVTGLADALDHTEGDILRALKYWEKQKLLRLETSAAKELQGIYLLKIPMPDAVTEPLVPEQEAGPPEAAVPKKRSYTPDELSSFSSQAQCRQLLFVCEQYLNKTLSPSEVETLLYFYDQLHFSADLIEYLVEYCVYRRHKSLRYIESVAMAWHKEGYTSASEAKEHTTTYSKAYFSILKAFGITSRNPVDAEISYMNQWIREYGFSLELITEACGRTMAAIHQPSFEYADKILSTWKKENVSSLSEVKALDARHRSSKAGAEPPSSRKTMAPSRFHNFRERSYDFNELEKQLINH